MKALKSQRESVINEKREKLEALFNRLNVPDAERARVKNDIPNQPTQATINKVTLLKQHSFSVVLSLSEVKYS